ncbi:MAG: hypothetical protein AAGE80_01415 [Pseudomonadota bacterium]
MPEKKRGKERGSAKGGSGQRPCDTVAETPPETAENFEHTIRRLVIEREQERAKLRGEI